jgi:hypothetical protein
VGCAGVSSAESDREYDACSVLPDSLVAGDCALRFVFPECQYRTKPRLRIPPKLTPLNDISSLSDECAASLRTRIDGVKLASGTAEGILPRTRSWGIRFRTGFIDCNIATGKILSVKSGYSRLRFAGITHGNECESARPASGSIGDEAHFGHGTVLREQIFKVVFRGREREISYKQFHNN